MRNSTQTGWVLCGYSAARRRVGRLRAAGRRGSVATAAMLTAALAVAAFAGCNRPCDQLEQRLCERTSDDAACERWKARLGRVSQESCEVGLRALDREALR